MLERGTDAPIELARVAVVGSDGEDRASALTDENGFFSLSVGDGEFVLRATALGYRPSRTEPLRLEGSDGVRVVQISLEAQPVAIEGVVVDARNSLLEGTGFYERMKEGRGQFLTPDDIAGSEARYTPEVFHGLDHVMPQYALPMWQRSVVYMSATERGNCTPRIYIDGVWWRWRAEGEGLMDAVPLEDLLAVEVYWGPFQAPLRYQGTTVENSCGVALLWTRYGRR